MAKLFTHHDPYHLHAALGLSMLVHFFARLVILPMLGWNYEGWHLLTALHCVLALTSFVFRIPLQRNSMYTIYREMQLHTIVFSIRSLVVYYWAVAGGPGGMIACLGLVLACHGLADLVTKLYGTPTGGTTIRRQVGDKSLYENRPWYDRAGVLAMSISQLVATWFLLASNVDRAPIVAFAVMLPVQGSAFLATLVRKGKISSYFAGYIYMGLIIIAFTHFPWSTRNLLFIAAACIGRFSFRLNKYLLWALLVAAVYMLPTLKPISPTSVLNFTLNDLPSISLRDLALPSMPSGSHLYQGVVELADSTQQTASELYQRGGAALAHLLA